MNEEIEYNRLCDCVLSLKTEGKKKATLNETIQSDNKTKQNK